MMHDIQQAWKIRRERVRQEKTTKQGERWLRAEVEATPEVADRSLRRVFRSISRPAPSAGFAERVLAEVLPYLPQPPSLSKDPFNRTSVRWAIASAFVLVGIVFGGLPQFLAAIGRHLRAGTVIEVVQRVPMLLSDSLTGIVGLWPLVASLGEAALASFSSPWFLTVFLTLTLMAVATMKVVTDLLARQKGFHHVHLA